MNPLVLWFSIVVNFAALALYLLFWYVFPVVLIASILFAVGYALTHLFKWVLALARDQHA